MLSASEKNNPKFLGCLEVQKNVRFTDVSQYEMKDNC